MLAMQVFKVPRPSFLNTGELTDAFVVVQCLLQNPDNPWPSPHPVV